MRILRALGIAPFLAGARDGLDAVRPSTVARRLGVSLELVKDRTRRMEERGVIAAYDVYPNPRLFGLEDITVHMQLDPSTKARILEEAKRLGGVIGVYDFVGPHVCIQLCFASRPQLDADLDALARLAGAPHRPSAYFQRRLPAPARPLSNLDLRILKALRHRARAPLPDIARETGVSTRTVKRHLTRMTKETQFDAFVEVDWSRIDGVLAIDMGVEVPRERLEEATAAAHRQFETHSLGEWRPPSDAFPALMMMLWARTPAEVEALRRQAEALPGARRAWAILAAGSNYSGAWLDEALEKAIAKSALPPPRAG